jgi:hypothetical protein
MLAVLAAICAAGAAGEAPSPLWERADRGTTPPKERYSHGMVVLPPTKDRERTIVVTHGYNNQKGPDWRDDTLVKIGTGPWTTLETQKKPPARYGHTFGESLFPSLAGALSHELFAAVALSKNSALLFGGDDGGGSSRGNSYHWGSYLSDQWVLTLSPGSDPIWKELPRGTSSPSRRSIHSMVAWYDCNVAGAESLALFGGLQPTADRVEHGSGIHDSAELWLARVTDSSSPAINWIPVCPRQAQDQWSVPLGTTATCTGVTPSAHEVWPLPRHGQSLASGWSTSRERVLYLFGGMSLRCDKSLRDWTNQTLVNSGACVFSDAWSLAFATTEDGFRTVGWQRLKTLSHKFRGSRFPWPIPRSHGGMVWVRGQGMTNGALVVYGGAQCAPGCHCLADAWMGWLPPGPSEYVLWKALLGDKAAADCTGGRQVGSVCPAPRYRHVLASDAISEQCVEGGGAVALFGGESYSPSKYYDDLWWFNTKTAEALYLSDQTLFDSLGGFHSIPSWLYLVLGGLVLVTLVVWAKSRRRHKPRVHDQ